MSKRDRKIIVLSGKQYSGKDTVANIMLEMIPDFKLMPLANAIKMELGEQKKISLQKIEMNKHMYRAELIELGNKRRSEDKDYWIKKVIASEDNIIVSDARLKHEVDIFSEEGAIKIRVESDRSARAERGTLVKEDDLTETDLDDYKNWDYVISNSGTLEELQEKVKPIIEEISRSMKLQKI